MNKEVKNIVEEGQHKAGETFDSILDATTEIVEVLYGNYLKERLDKLGSNEEKLEFLESFVMHLVGPVSLEVISRVGSFGADDLKEIKDIHYSIVNDFYGYIGGSDKDE